MKNYILRRLALIPLTLFAIILVNFAILNLAPGDPTSLSNLSATGDAVRSAADGADTAEDQYLLFREHYGLTLPILLNFWPFLKEAHVQHGLKKLISIKEKSRIQDYNKQRLLWSDRARFIMPFLLQEAQSNSNPLEIRRLAANLFIRGGTKMGAVGHTLTQQMRKQNSAIAASNNELNALKVSNHDNSEMIETKVAKLAQWFNSRGGAETFSKPFSAKLASLVLETRFCRYLSRVATLDFGTLRNDSNKKVVHEVAARIKYSLTLAVIPLLGTFILCQLFGMWMAVKQNRWQDHLLNILFLILFAIPVFVVAPFLIEHLALNKTLPFTDISIPYSGFHSPKELYSSMTSLQRLGDIVLHIVLPIIAIKYGTMAVQARLARTAFLEVLRQDYIRTARAKGLKKKTILFKHVGRSAAITLVTSLAASLGVVLGGSLIVETIFEINGFGKFFYDAIVNRDYNVVLFSALAGSLLSLLGFLAADIFYTLLDPRVNFE